MQQIFIRVLGQCCLLFELSLKLGIADEPEDSSDFPSLHSLIMDTTTELSRLQDSLGAALEVFPDLAAANQPGPPTEQQQQQQLQRSRPQQQ